MVASATSSPALSRKTSDSILVINDLPKGSPSQSLKRSSKKEVRRTRTSSLSFVRTPLKELRKSLSKSLSKGSTDDLDKVDGNNNEAAEERRVSDVSFDAVSREDFVISYRKKLKEDQLQYEFKALDKSEDVALAQCSGQLLSNQSKNFSDQHLPYDHCRVCLERNASSQETSDYINASYINSISATSTTDHSKKLYIATQGPVTASIADFWLMLWQQGCDTIIMLTSIFIYSKQECEKYWPESTVVYDDLTIKVMDTIQTCHYTIRTFTLSKNGCNEERTIRQFQFQTWTENIMPDVSALLEFRRQVHKYPRNTDRPVVVHCSTGCGRTGAYLAIDMVLTALSRQSSIDVLGTVSYLRKWRPRMVSNVLQLHTIYEATATHVICGRTVIPTRDIHSTIRKLSERKDGGTLSKLTGFELELKTLNELTPKINIGDCAGGHRAENRRKSRDIMVQPPESARPYLLTFDSSESSDFINAVFINGYQRLNEYIVSQWPLKSTINDYWRLVYDKQISSAVVLHDSKGHSKAFPDFWPTRVGVRERYGPLCVTLTESESTPNYRIKTFSIRKALYTDMIETEGHLSRLNDKERQFYHHNMSSYIGQIGQAMMSPADAVQNNTELRTMQMVFLKTWPEELKIPQHNNVLVDLMSRSEHWKNSQATARTPTLVISKNGVSRAGVFCSLSICVEQHRSCGEIDVFNAVKTVKRNRPQLVENPVEFISIYIMISELSPRNAFGRSMTYESSLCENVYADSSPLLYDNRGQRNDRTSKDTVQHSRNVNGGITPRRSASGGYCNQVSLDSYDSSSFVMDMDVIKMEQLEFTDMPTATTHI